MSKLLNPKVWYLLGIGAAALALDAGRRWVTKRRQEAEQGIAPNTGIPLTSFAPAKATPAAPMSAASTPAAASVAQSSAAPTPVASTPVASTPATRAPRKRPAKSDDLTAIKGIGPTFARRLAEAGYTSFAALAGATPDHLREVTKAPLMANPDDWIAQARLLA
ncbi:MAG TPA: helix-hairpin-helix domain-containing protein [Promineifilum sp.]|nr:helix-hairpin-helix domain-containing protein [Promineifilum sp.]HRO22994.1 helix-hairpin-helix domain-containing protein [Promineifilum sp.]HRQ12622.1 helix-hairpin-helix domain-containing protein [Promineifilum sp.]